MGQEEMVLGVLATLMLLGVAALAPSAAAQGEASPPPEDTVVIRSTTDPDVAADLLTGFRALHPGIRVDYTKLTSSALNERFLSEAAANAVTTDILWSSAMDLQMKLVNDGYAQRYVSPEADALPGWAVWRNEAYAATAEPVGFVYNRTLLPELRVPRTHAELEHALTADPDVWKGRLAAYDPERSGAGFLFLTRDVEETPRTWELVRAMGQVGVKLYTATETMLDRVASGEALLAYDVLGSYALDRAKHEPALGVVLPSDYTVVVSRIAFIPRLAPHPNAARMFLDYLLSHDGQMRLAARSVTPVRQDARTDSLPQMSEAALRPIPVGPELLTWLDQIKRRRFLRQWRHALDGR
jgi:iron(III) transport system substrate-binding protein